MIREWKEMRKTRSREGWVKRQNKDQYVQASRKEGLRSRAAFKLEQINKKYKILDSGCRVLDLGCAPGGWLKVARKYVGDSGKIVGVDLLDVDPIKGVDFIKGDFRDPKIVEQIQERLGIRGLDLVISDMAPNMSGNRTTDQARAMHLADLALDAACRWLNPGGAMAVKLFQGAGVDAWMAEVRKHFDKARLVKPEASRSESREVYAVAQGFVPETEG